MLGWIEARRLVVDEIARGGPIGRTERVDLDAAAGRVLAEDVRLDRDQPPFDRATRDGFAARAADAGAPPVELLVAGEARAGAPFGGEMAAGSCVEIMTGAPLPRGADAVVMVEDTETLAPDRVLVRRAAAAGDNFVPRGSEGRSGALAMARGTRVDPASVALLASVGAAAPLVHARPRVAILPTGDEIVDVAATPGPAQIRNSNGWSLAAQVARAGGEAWRLPAARDEYGALRADVERALGGADLLVLSGGVSMGKYDLVERVLTDLGATIHFDAVAIRPGKPAVFGRVAGRPFFGLPGNPLSTLVTFELFARPAIAVLGGETPAPPLPLLRAPLAAAYRQRPLPLTLFVPAALEDDGGALRAAPLVTQGSGDLPAMARAHGFVVVPPGTAELPAGEMVEFLPR